MKSKQTTNGGLRWNNGSTNTIHHNELNLKNVVALRMCAISQINNQMLLPSLVSTRNTSCLNLLLIFDYVQCSQSSPEKCARWSNVQAAYFYWYVSLLLTSSSKYDRRSVRSEKISTRRRKGGLMAQENTQVTAVRVLCEMKSKCTVIKSFE